PLGFGQTLRRALVHGVQDRGQRGVDVVWRHGKQTDASGFGAVENVAGQVVASRRPFTKSAQRGERDDRRRHAERYLGERKRGGRRGQCDVASTYEAEATASD